jgi:hypothetical protein
MRRIFDKKTFKSFSSLSNTFSYMSLKIINTRHVTISFDRRIILHIKCILKIFLIKYVGILQRMTNFLLHPSMIHRKLFPDFFMSNTRKFKEGGYRFKIIQMIRRFHTYISRKWFLHNRINSGPFTLGRPDAAAIR